MDMSDVIFDNSIPMYIRRAFLDFTELEPNVQAYTKILKRTHSNDDVNGSQNGGSNTDFTYEDVSTYDVSNASSLGYYEYFSDYNGVYTGHYYQGEETKFSAVVIDPPEYAIQMHV